MNTKQAQPTPQAKQATSIDVSPQTSAQTQATAHPLWQAVRIVPDFPKAGINFFDISPLLLEHINELIDALLETLPTEVLAEADYFAGIESRGFLFASMLSAKTGKGMLMIRKANKLPPPVASMSYALEYGEDTLEIQAHITDKKIILVDDVLATGGTLGAAIQLCQQVDNQVLAALVLIDIAELHDEMATSVYKVFTA